MNELGFFDGVRVQLIDAANTGRHAFPMQEMNSILVKALPDGYPSRHSPTSRK